MHLIIHRLYSTDALLATPSPVDQLSSRVSALRLGGCGFKPGHTKDSKNGTRCLLRVLGHGLGVLIKPFYSILKRPLWLPPNMAPKVHTKKKSDHRILFHMVELLPLSDDAGHSAHRDLNAPECFSPLFCVLRQSCLGGQFAFLLGLSSHTHR